MSWDDGVDDLFVERPERIPFHIGHGLRRTLLQHELAQSLDRHSSSSDGCRRREFELYLQEEDWSCALENIPRTVGNLGSSHPRTTPESTNLTSFLFDKRVYTKFTRLIGNKKRSVRKSQVMSFWHVARRKGRATYAKSQISTLRSPRDSSIQ